MLCILYVLLLFLLISGGLGLGGETECEHAHVTADDVGLYFKSVDACAWIKSTFPLFTT